MTAKLSAEGGCAVSHDALEMMFFPVADEDKPGEWTAEISFVVRYHHPADNVEEFVNFYISHHPQIESRFPNIRSIMCYVPVKWDDPTSLPHENYLLGNEVVFDSVEDLGGALNSPVINDMRADFENFPPFQGGNTHYAMRRRRIS